MEVVLLLVGAGIGWLITHVYYVLAKRDTQKQVEATRTMLSALEAIVTSLEQNGMISVERDAKGNYTPNYKIITGKIVATLGPLT